MKQPIPYTKMLAEAKNSKGATGLGLELLKFLMVFFVIQMIQGIPTTIATAIWLFTSEEVMSEIMNAASSGLSAEYIDTVMQAVSATPPWLMVVQLFSTVIATVIAILFCLWIEKRKPASMGLCRGGAFKEYLVGAGVGIALISLCVGLAAAFGSFSFALVSFPVGLWIAYLIGFLIQGMSEEVLCRGYLMISITRKNSIPLAVAANAVMFALLHIFNPGIGIIPLVNIALFGAFASVYALKRGNLWGVCAAHSLWNFFQGNVFGISVSGMGVSVSPLQATLQNENAWLHGGAFGIEGGIVTTLILSLALLAALLYLPAKQDEVAENVVENDLESNDFM